MCSDTASNEAVVWDTVGWLPSRPLHSDNSATLSATGTVDGSTSNALDHVTSPCAGSGASSTRPPPALLVTLAISMASADQVGRLLRPHVDGGGESDRAVDDHADAHAEVGVVGRRVRMRVVEAHRLAPDALDPELGRLAAEAAPSAASASAERSSGASGISRPGWAAQGAGRRRRRWRR